METFAGLSEARCRFATREIPARGRRMHLDCPRFPSILAKGVIMVEWKDPEPTTSELLANAARELRANPGRWGIIKHSNSTLTYALRKGRYVAFRPATDWE